MFTTLQKQPVVITGASRGIGLATTKLFLEQGWKVHGIDVIQSPMDGHMMYTHYLADVRNKRELPTLQNVGILINNAGVQDSGDDIGVNLMGTINCTEKYIGPYIKSILNQASVSAHNGAEFPEYCASKGGVLAYTINTAKRVAVYGAVCNSISFGGVSTDLNRPVMEDLQTWEEIMQMTPLRKWVRPEEAAEWIYFLTVVNRSMTGQDIIVDNGESRNHRFVWK